MKVIFLLWHLINCMSVCLCMQNLQITLVERIILARLTVATEDLNLLPEKQVRFWKVFYYAVVEHYTWPGWNISLIKGLRLAKIFARYPLECQRRLMEFGIRYSYRSMMTRYHYVLWSCYSASNRPASATLSWDTVSHRERIALLHISKGICSSHYIKFHQLVQHLFLTFFLNLNLN